MKHIFKSIAFIFAIIWVFYGLSNPVFAEGETPVKFQLKTQVTIETSWVSQFAHFFKLTENKNTKWVITSGPKQILWLDWWEVWFQDGTKTWIQESNLKVDSVELISNLRPTITIYSATNDTLYLASSSSDGSIDDTLTMITTRFTSQPKEQINILQDTSTGETETVLSDTTNETTISLITSSFESESIWGVATSDFLSIPESENTSDSPTSESNTIILFASILSSNSIERDPYFFLEKPIETSTASGEILSEEVVSMITTFFRNQESYSISIGDILEIPESTIELSTSWTSENLDTVIISTFDTYIGYINPFQRNMPESEVELSSASEGSSISTITSIFTTYTSEIKNWYNSK